MDSGLILCLTSSFSLPECLAQGKGGCIKGVSLGWPFTPGNIFIVPFISRPVRDFWHLAMLSAETLEGRRAPGGWGGTQGGQCAESLSAASLVMPIKQNKLEVKCPGPWVLPAPANGLQAGGCFPGEGDHLSLGNAPPWDCGAG